MTAITARGTSTRHYPAERATLGIRIESIESERFDSISGNGEKHNAALNRVRELEDSGDATWTHSDAPVTYERHVKSTSSVPGAPEYVVEYVTSSRVLVKVSNLSLVSGLVREFSFLGTTSVSWALTEASRTQYESYARRRSVEKARDIAADYAEALQKDIVSVISISDVDQGVSVAGVRGGAGASNSAAAEVSIPEITITASVTGEYSAE